MDYRNDWTCDYPSNVARRHSKNQILLLTGMLFFLSIGSAFNVQIGLAVKPYMIMLLLLMFYYLSQITIEKLLFFEMAFVGFYVYYDLRGVITAYPAAALRAMGATFILLVFYFFCRYWLNQIRWKDIEWAIIISGFVFNLLSLGYYVMGLVNLGFNMHGNGIRELGVMIDRDFARLLGLTNDPNIFVFINMLFIAYFLTHREKWWNLLGGFIGILCVMLTLSRGAIISLVIVLVLCLLVGSVRSKLMMVLGAVGFFLLANLFFDQFMEVSLWELLLERFGTVSEDGGSGRFDIWTDGLAYFMDKPLFGIGSFNFQAYHSFAAGKAIFMHNSFLEILVETGIVGMMFYVTAIVALVWTLVKAALVDKEQWWLLIALIGYLSMMTSLSLILNEIFFFFFALVARSLKEKERNIERRKGWRT
ncbi:O-antigen ligase family protein [Listeria booriae]|uniref:O-antigen ligase family protein n=1 Tax=Listeria booriae TaxID=1552123 RepID=UPI0016293367|nr:O-antigen ligase family protein [Listeria booriae]MBC1798624.1 O-antigen ligase family protein [Listeria booriae]MBC1814015.1 O-antigen ligase family protein [Listeria booriae]MBC2049181.1 O-antigen ligase family protein [Listeria booriae]MBC2079901.1 O-antigen ligase family protein [Listeria booriae]